MSLSGANDYMITSTDIIDMPSGDSTVLTDVLAQMPGVSIDQNQQVHIRDTEGSGYQYQVNGVLLPYDINTNPPFISMINPLFISRIDLIDGVLPAKYSYSTGGVLDIQTKDGCKQPGGDVTIYGGQRGTIEPSVQYAGCSGRLSYYGSLLYNQSDLGFSSATPSVNPIHDRTNQGQAFGLVSYAFDNNKLSLMFSTSDSNNQLPNAPNQPAQFYLAPQTSLAGEAGAQSAAINSYLNFRDYLGVISLSGSPTQAVSYQVSYSVHSISQSYLPDNAGELIFQGVASTALHDDFDNILQADLTYTTDHHTLTTGAYLGAYDVTSRSNSQVFQADAYGNQTSGVPQEVNNYTHQMNVLSGVYVNDLWQISQQLRANLGLRFDDLTGISPGNQISPTVNLSYMPSSATTYHAGLSRDFQVPSFEGISARAPASFVGTTGAGPNGVTNPLTEDDWQVDAGVVHKIAHGLTASVDGFYETTRHYLDAGQFGAVPIFAPFNYQHGHIWGAEIAIDYRSTNLNAYSNLTLGKNYEKGVATGQYNFTEPGELQYIDTHYIVLDHQPLFSLSSGLTYRWGAYKFGADAIYNTGLRTGFANLDGLPNVFQINASAERKFEIAGHRLSDRIVLLNLLDRTNLIRPSGGLGVFESAYGPRFTVLDSLTLSF